MIIQTTAGELFQVRETGDASLEHVWLGVAVKRSGENFIPKKNAREILVRKMATRVVRAA